MAHPRGLLGRQVGEELALLDAQLGLAELAGAPIDAAAELLRHQVHAVTDAEGRDAELEDRRIDVRRVVRVDRCASPGEDQRYGVAAANLFGGDAMRDELRVDPRLANAAGDQLRVLPAEVDHQHRPLLRKRLGTKRDNLSFGGSSARP